MSSTGTAQKVLSASDLASKIAARNYSASSATVIGYGNMGRQYVRALQKLGVRHIHVCSRSGEPLSQLKDAPNITTVSGGYERLDKEPAPDELGIVATPTADLVAAARYLARRGYRRILIEKPVSLLSADIEQLDAELQREKVDVACAYNRVAYPSFHEVRARSQEDGGITSCTYTFTEFVHRIGPDSFSKEELARWGIANSLHVMSMAHGLIGAPKVWSGHRTGSISWHTTGSVFVGSGISTEGIPFAYHADWGSAGRWSVEIHTAKDSYRLCPLENLFRKSSPAGEWEEIPVAAFAPEIKTGFVEQVAAMLVAPPERFIRMSALQEVAQLTRYAEELFGYER